MEPIHSPPQLYRSAAMIGLYTDTFGKPYKHAFAYLKSEINDELSTIEETRMYKRISDMLELAAMWIDSDCIMTEGSSSDIVLNIVSNACSFIKLMKIKQRRKYLTNFELAYYFKDAISAALKPLV